MRPDLLSYMINVDNRLFTCPRCLIRPVSLKNRLPLTQFRLRFHPLFSVVSNAFNIMLPLL